MILVCAFGYSAGFDDISHVKWAAGGQPCNQTYFAFPVCGAGGARRRRGFCLVLGLTSLMAVAAFGSACAASAKSESKEICRSEDFSGCCSWNGGVANELTGQCRNGNVSKTCDAKWETNLRGRCSWNKGVAAVDSNGVVYCNNDKAPGTPIPKCAAPTQ